MNDPNGFTATPLWNDGDDPGQLNALRAPTPAYAWRKDAKIAAAWGLLAALATVALMPYLMQLMPQKFASMPVPLPVLILAQAVQALLLMGLLSFAGLRMGHSVGLGSPLMQHWINRVALPAQQPRWWLRSIVPGAAVAVVIIALAALIDPMLPKMIRPPANAEIETAALNGLLASFYGGIAEELQLRLFVMTLFVWMFARIRKRAPTAAVYGVALAGAALLFGIGHLPAANEVWGLDSIVVFRTIALNAIGGIVFGWIFWKRGLEAAVVAHFSADVVLHVLAPLMSIGPSP